MSSDDVKTGGVAVAPDIAPAQIIEPAPNVAPAGWTRREIKGLPAAIDAFWTQRHESGWRYAIQVDKSHCNSQGVVHGGVLMTFVDHALSMMIWEASGRAQCATVHLDSHFLKAVRPPAFVELEGQILKQGRTMAFARGVLRVDGVEVMQANGVWSITPVVPTLGSS